MEVVVFDEKFYTKFTGTSVPWFDCCYCLISLGPKNRVAINRKLLLRALILVFFTMHFRIMKAETKLIVDNNLTRQQQSIVLISALTAAGKSESLENALAEGLETGLTINQINEILVQLYAYCGFPRSLNGINLFMVVVNQRREKGINDEQGVTATVVTDSNKYQTGKQTLQKLTGREETAPAGANAFAPAIDNFLKEHLFADIFSRDVLTYQQRELITVSALAAMSGVTPQLQAHLGMAMNTGLTEPQLQQAFKIVDLSVGKQHGDLSRETLSRLLSSK